jgi:hypothetical protein
VSGGLPASAGEAVSAKTATSRSERGILGIVSTDFQSAARENQVYTRREI